MSAVFLSLPPSPDLRPIVRCHQIIRLRFGVGNAVPAKPYWPRPAIALAFYPRARERVHALGDGGATVKPRAALIGQPTKMTMRQGGHDFSVYQIELRAGGLHRLTGIPAHLLTDRYVDAESVFPAGFRALVDAIEDTEDPAQMIRLTEHYLRSVETHVARQSSSAFEHAAQHLIAGTLTDIDALANATDIVPRQLHRLFLSQAGVSPRLFRRIARFDRTIRLSNRQPADTWWGTAVDAGYYDHQHMARDFRAFTGLGPAEFRALEHRAPERVFGRAES